MKIGILLQARTDSKRFPKKIWKKINEKTMLEIIIERLKNIKNTDLIIVTTKKRSDDKIIELCKKLKINFFRGKANDVLSRFYDTSKQFKLNTIIRCNADCPLIDRKLLVRMLDKYKKNKYDYMSNILVPSYPSGLHIEIMNFKSLKIAHKNASKLSEREHVTPYIYNNPKKFKLFSIKNNKDLSFHRWTIDFKEDLIFMKKIFKAFKRNEYFGMEKVLKFIEKNPKIKNINYSIKKKQNLIYK